MNKVLTGAFAPSATTNATSLLNPRTSREPQAFREERHAEHLQTVASAIGGRHGRELVRRKHG